MSRLFSIILALIGLLILWNIGGWFFASFVGRIEAGPAQVVRIDHALTNKEVAALLQDQYHIIASARGYRAYTVFARISGAKPGTYELEAGRRYSDIAAILAHGPQRTEREVRVIEGWSIKDQAQQLAGWNAAWSTDFMKSTGQVAGSMPFDPKWRIAFPFLQTLPPNRSLDGYLFPDTYRVWEDEMPDNLIRKQLKTFDQKVYQPWKDTALPEPLKNFDEVIILASIVEKEVQSTEDRAIVAGLFLRRMREGMALQSDATLTYITGSKRGRATPEDLALISAYNSYAHTGLPPGPISHPALSAIEAVFHPTKTTYRYFLTDKNNKVLYATTFDEHVRNKVRAGY